MKPKIMPMSYQEAEKIIRQFGHSVTRKKHEGNYVNVITWSINGRDAIKTTHSNENVKIIGLAIKKFNSDTIVFASLAKHIEKE